MDVIDHQQAARKAALEAELMQANREELVEHIRRAMPNDGVVQPLPGLQLYRFSLPSEPKYDVIKPCVCVIAQGSKQVLLGKSLYRYDPLHYLLVTIGLPAVIQMLEASKERPYLSISLDLAPTLVNSIQLEAGLAQPPGPADVRAIAVNPLDEHLLDAFVRLARLLDAPAETPVLGPLIAREMIYRLLVGEQGARLRHITLPGGVAPSIAQAVARLRHDFAQPLRIEEMAREFGMSASRLRRHFKAVTAMSPSQFQKQLRLQEARRLMLSEDLDAQIVASRVGYLDASHFTREYKSFFGVSPLRDMQRLQEEAQDRAGQ